MYGPCPSTQTPICVVEAYPPHCFRRYYYSGFEPTPPVCRWRGQGDRFDARIPHPVTRRKRPPLFREERIPRCLFDTTPRHALCVLVIGVVIGCDRSSLDVCDGVWVSVSGCRNGMVSRRIISRTRAVGHHGPITGRHTGPHPHTAYHSTHGPGCRGSTSIATQYAALDTPA